MLSEQTYSSPKWPIYLACVSGGILSVTIWPFYEISRMNTHTSFATSGGELAAQLKQMEMWMNYMLLVIMALIVLAIVLIIGYTARAVWKVTVNSEGLVLNTVLSTKKISWSSIRSVDSSMNQAGRTVYTVRTYKNGSFYMDATMDPNKTLLETLRDTIYKNASKEFETSGASSTCNKLHGVPLTFKMPWLITVEWLLRIPFLVVALFFVVAAFKVEDSVFIHQVVTSGFGAGAASIVAVCLYACRSVELDSREFSYKSLLSGWTMPWSGKIRVTNWAIYTPVGSSLIWPIGNCDLLRAQVAFYTANAFADAPSKIRGGRAAAAVVILCACLPLVCNLDWSWMAISFAATITILDFWRIRSILRTLICACLIYAAGWITFSVPPVVNPSSSAIERYLTWSKDANLMHYEKCGAPLSVLNYRFSAPVELGEAYKNKVDASNVFEETHTWSNSFAPFNIGYSADWRVTEDRDLPTIRRPDREHPLGMKNVWWEDCGTVEQGGLKFSVRKWKGGARGWHVFGIDYVAQDGRRTILLRVYSDQRYQSTTLARAQSMLSSFQKIAENPAVKVQITGAVPTGHAHPNSMIRHSRR